MAATSPTSSLSAETIEEQLEQYVETALSSRRTATQPALDLANFDRAIQENVLQQVAVMASTNAELAYQFASLASQALGQMDAEEMRAWMMRAMDVFDSSGLHAAVAVLRDIDGFARQCHLRRSGLALESVQRVMENFLHGLNGRPLSIAHADENYTDTQTIFLPVMVGLFADAKDNFRVYKAMAVFCWAQTWYGTWRIDPSARLNRYADAGKAELWFHFLECIRLEACIERDLPGVHRDMLWLKTRSPPALAPDEAMRALQSPQADVETSLWLLDTYYPLPLPEHAPVCYHGRFNIAQTEAVKAARMLKEKEQLQKRLAVLKQDITSSLSQPEQTEKPQPSFAVNMDASVLELQFDGATVVAPPEVKTLLVSVYQDLGEIPDEYLVPAGAGAYDAHAAPKDPRDVWKGTYHEEGAFIYPEWDFERRHYRKNWAVLRELDVHPQWDGFVAKTKHKYAGLIKQLRRGFEALRGEDKWLKKQLVGEDIDLDALVQAHADMQSGMEMSQRLFTKMQKIDRNIAVMFMVDMSGSTKGWINDAEREALVLLCESLQALGDRYAIYGFTSLTHKRCEVLRIKRFDEAYDDTVKARISGITPQDYTRMGVAIRHLCGILKKIEARTKILITLSDGKPDDWDSYRGQYGIEDTRQALIEAKRDNIHPFCVTIDTEAKSYLPHMYGAVNFTVIDQVHKLPVKIADIYRRLTV